MTLLPAIDRYILRLTLVPMISVFAVAASLLMLDKMLSLFDFVASEGGPIGIVFRMLANLLPEYASLAIPLGVLLGILLAFRNLALSSELDALRGQGFSYTRLLRVPYAISVLMMGVNFAIVGYLQPLSYYYYEELQYELRSGALGASIKVGEFNAIEDRMALRIDASEDDGRELRGIFGRVMAGDGQELSISAREGRFLASRETRDTIILRLVDGRIVHRDGDSLPRVFSFAQHDLPIDLPAIERFRERGELQKEYILPELLKIGWSRESSAAERDQSQSAFNFRMVEVLMMLFVPLLAVALAIPPKRSTSALGVFVAIVMVVAYHKINEYGQSLGALGRFDPFLALWGPFVLFAALIFWMYYRVAYVPGGQAIGALEAVFGKITKQMKAIFRRRERRQRKALREQAHLDDLDMEGAAPDAA